MTKKIDVKLILSGGEVKSFKTLFLPGTNKDPRMLVKINDLDKFDKLFMSNPGYIKETFVPFRLMATINKVKSKILAGRDNDLPCCKYDKSKNYIYFEKHLEIYLAFRTLKTREFPIWTDIISYSIFKNLNLLSDK